MNDLEFSNTDHNREYKQKFLQIMEENLLEVERIDFASTMVSLQISSLAFIKIVVFLEEEFNIEFEDEKIIPDAFATVQELFDYVYKKAL